ncbi:hypothetical protein D1BOALGB6SA_1847 [Olavius sp. associated proteobacterium Delta 1]|nr:hypothetical protein D1BOALGB6SA_1847 [Olavius sp. associated proteobacterium Delta 1]
MISILNLSKGADKYPPLCKRRPDHYLRHNFKKVNDKNLNNDHK